MDNWPQDYKKPANPPEFVDLVISAAVGDGLPSEPPIDFSARRSKPPIVVACAPKSGSTFLSNVLSQITDMPYFRLSSAYGTNEHDLYLPALYMANENGCVSQLHMKGTFHNAALLKKFGIKPVIVVRNIEDTIVSLADDLRSKEAHLYFGSGDLGFSFLWHDHAIASLNEPSLIDCLIDLAIPWYVNFYVSWHRLCERCDVDAMWITYEELMQDKRKTISDILEFTGFGKGVHIEDALLEKRYPKFNKAQSGRGSIILSEEQKTKIRRLFSYYPDIDFSKYGIENNKVSIKISTDTEKSPTSDDLVDIGEQHNQAGHLQEAESCFRKALELDPGHPGALFYLANIAYEDNRLLFAKQLLDDLLRGEPNDAEAWYLLGVVALKEENIPRGVECLRKAVTLQPDYVQAHYSLGVALGACGELNAALDSYRKVLACNPQVAEVHAALGMIYQLQNNYEAALSSFQQAVNINPHFEMAYLNIGQIFRSEAKLEDAIKTYQAALLKLPNATEMYLNLGIAQLESEQLSAATSNFERAIALDPNCAEAHRGIGIVSLQSGKLSEAVASFRQAVMLMPQNAHLRMDLGDAFNRIGSLTEAIDCWRGAIAADPDFAEPYHHLLHYSQYFPGYSRKQIFDSHVAFGNRFETAWRGKWFSHVKPVNSKKRLRVGFVSGNMNNHPVAHFLESVLHELRKLDDVDIILYSTNATEHEVTERIRAEAHAWIPVFTLSDDIFAQKIRDDQIDILVDLSGHTHFNRLLVFARKPAPIQVTWLGYWETTGLQAMDYILCDRYSVRDDEANWFVERPWYLPNTRLCFTLPAEAVAVAPLPAFSRGYVTFGCFNNQIKITDRVVVVWSRILKRVPNSRLLLKWQSYADMAAREALASRFVNEGISTERLEFQEASPRREYFLAYNRVDIALDPFPFPGGTTSIQGIWMGVPMVTLQGDRIVSRQGESILHNLGLSDWVAQSEDEYVDLTVQKAADLAGLARLRGELRAKLESSPLCDAKTFAQNLEDAFKQMWEKFASSV